ncbi:hypothetical protein GCM10010289_79230 [Streptomyces violascens]|uniref:Beta-lactamase-related domain-containing protein n=1 Tax=Streptomyces violascens TaxID=67381 RepID=A0ABQ3QF21_9ACTN|nr:hypothetical protein GCM10010289_79230 [Streptomyces violascens]GHI35840.1 hypothetical protein Sviol_02480 [Streptomyces violascens]
MSLSKHINDDLPHAVAELADGLVTSGILPGVSVLVLQDTDEVLYHEAGLRDVARARPMTRDAIFRLFSMTKPVTAAAVMALVDEGLIGLQDPLGDWVPELADLRVHPGSGGGMSVPAHPARIQHLLTHTAGFSYWFHPRHAVAALYADDPGIGVHERWRFDPALGGLDGLAESLARLPLVAQPGEKWHYSMAFEVAGMVVERAAGQPLDKFMAKRLFEPLGMKDTAFSVPPGDADRLASLYGPGAASNCWKAGTRALW